MNSRNSLAVAALALAAFALAGCEADGTVAEEGGVVASSDGIIPNDGTTDTFITEGGVAVAGNFVCTRSATILGPSTTIGLNGLVGEALTDGLNQLGAESATALLNSVSDKDLVVDGYLDTFATFTVTADLGFGSLSSIDEIIDLKVEVPSGRYAVFGVSFPIATLEASGLTEVAVTTFLGDVEQETNSLDDSTLDLLGALQVGLPAAFVGVRTTLPYNRVVISLFPGVISADVGEAMHVHELCVDGILVPAPAP